MGQQASTGITLFNSFWNYFTPLFGAYFADTYLGRFNTICISVCIAIVGHVILIASAAPSVIAKPNSALGAFVIGIFIMGCGTGGFKPNVSPLIAEQVKWHKLKIKTLKSGERVVVDPAVTTARIYNWFYFIINVGALIGQISMSYVERYVGFYLAFLIPTAVYITSLPVLFLAKKSYNLRPPEGSVLGPAVKLLVRGANGRWHLNPITTWKHMNDGTFWDNLKPSHRDPATRPTWMTFDDAWVDEVRRGWSACQVFLWLPFWWLTYGQLTNNLTSQAATMDLHGVPNDILANLDPLALIIFIPVCDILLYPALRKANIRFTPIKKITFGFFVGSAAMVWAAIVQLYIYRTSPCGYQASSCDTPAPINVWAQTGSYVLIAFSEIFASITSLEYGFSKAPKNMRSLVAAFALFMNALSSALQEAWLPLLKDPHIVWNYASVAIIAFFFGFAFYGFNLSIDREEDRLNQLATGRMGRGMEGEDVAHQEARQTSVYGHEKVDPPNGAESSPNTSEPAQHRDVSQTPLGESEKSN